MTTNHNFQKNINHLIALYLNDELSGDEKTFVENWCKDHPAEYQFIRDAFDREPEPISTDVDAAWENVSKEIGVHTRPKKIRYLFYSSVAASILLIIGIFFLKPSSDIGKNITAEVLKGSFISTDSIRECLLPDGSKVTLQKNSRLAYNWENENIRQATLEGEGFFEVQHNEKKPFTVETDHQKITVLGTSFVVNTKTVNGDEEVYVKSGRVSVKALKENSEIILSKGESSILNTEGLHKNQHVDVNKYAWATNELSFQNQHLSDVVKTLEDNFGVKITLENNVGKSLVTADFQQKSLEGILKELSLIVGFQYEKTVAGYLITGK